MQSIKVNVKTNANYIARTMKKRIKRLDTDTSNIVKTVSQFGKELMVRIAPHDTGLTARAIKWVVGNTGKHATIVIGEGHRNRVGKISTSRGTGGLTMYMNFGNHDSTHWKNGGEPRFIEVAQTEIDKRFKRRARTVFNAFVK